MLDYGSLGARIVVIGRTRFDTGIGAIGYGTAELLARNFPVFYRPTEPEAQSLATVTLPNGRVLPVLPAGATATISVFCDVPWNGAGDAKADLIPTSGLRYAWLLFDSDALPDPWVEVINRRVDAVLVPSAHLLDGFARSGVKVPAHILPIPLDLDPVLARSAAAPSGAAHDGPFTFGSVASFHPRKHPETLVAAFRARFEGDMSVRLVLHGDLAFGTTLAEVEALAAGAANIRISHTALSAAEKDALIASFDVFASCSSGEGYGIGPREALAAGKVVVASAVGGHLELAGIPGAFLVAPARRVPAHYPEIDGIVCGLQHEVAADDVAQALVQARRFVAGDIGHSVGARRIAASRWSFSALASSVGALVDPAIARYRPTSHPPTAAIEALVEARLGRRGDSIGGVRRQVCPAHDGGFFSVFNTFFSHFVWQQREDRCHGVLPDWDIDRFLGRLEAPLRSFCYGQPGDGNLWCRLFEPLLGSTDAEMQDDAYLWRHAEFPRDRHNEAREPSMTYVRAYTLYQSAEFQAWRRQYHRVFAAHIRLRPELAAEIEAFAAEHLAAPIRIAAHVRHPSHTVEQPDGRIAGTEAYIERIRDILRRHDLDPADEGWAVFVATDQDQVLHRFREAFGARAVFYPDARRTQDDEDAAFHALSPAERNRDGHQLQHLVAADPAGWNWRMAWEVVRDATTMARCQCLLHVVSNVSTAVAYMNPEIEMVFCPA